MGNAKKAEKQEPMNLAQLHPHIEETIKEAKETYKGVNYAEAMVDNEWDPSGVPGGGVIEEDIE